MWIQLVVGLLAALIAGVGYLAWYLHWERRQTTGMAYYGRPLAGRRALKQRMRLLSLPAKPIVRLLSLAMRPSKIPGFDFEGVAGPPGVSSPDVFAKAKAYRPTPQDVFVATQMRCGTTWMQQIVFEIVTRGRGDLTDAGYGHLYAVSPWIDAINSVSMTDAPLVGDPPTRIVKCHLPADLCPYSPDARYIYVTRHPVSCFASIVDYNRSLLGPLTPPLDVFADWYCSDRMYWRPWPQHVEGWWQWAQRKPNVLFVHFEEMTKDLPGAIDRVAAFLGCALTSDERARIAERCGFRAMKAMEEYFEMAPPTMFSVSGGQFLASGKATRHEDTTPEISRRIADYCLDALSTAEYPIARFYPDLRPARVVEEKAS
jgi:hypothetical protein